MEQNVDIVAMISSGDMHPSVPSLLNYLSDDVEYFMLANRPDSPLIRRMHGREKVSEYLSLMPLMYEIATRTVHKVVRDGSHTILTGRDLVAIYPDKRRVTMDWTAIVVMQSGKIRKLQYIFQNIVDCA